MTLKTVIPFLLPLREKVASEGGRMRGCASLSAAPVHNRPTLIDPSSVGFADTFSRKGRRERSVHG